MAAHLHWRLYITALNTATAVDIGEVEMRSTAGGSNLCSGGTASSNNTLTGQSPANAFDGSLSTSWQTFSFPAIPGPWLRYSFASAVDIVQVVIKATSGPSYSYAPKACDIQWSDDGTTWTTLFSAEGMAAWTSGSSYTATLGGGPVRATQQSLETLATIDPASVRATQQSLEVLYTAAYAVSTVPGYIYQVNCGSTYTDPSTVWGNDPDTSSTTLTGLIPSVGGSSSVTYTCNNWDTALTDGVAHADLPSGVSASYLKWFAGPRIVTMGGLNAAKTYTLRLYSTAPGSVSVNWTVGASTKALARGSKVEWTGLVPDGSLQITATSASTTSGSDATLSAVILIEEQTQPAPTLTVRATSQLLETLIATYQQRLYKAVGYAVLGTGPGVSIAKSVGFAVLSDPSFVTLTDTQTVLLLHFEGAHNSTSFVDSSPSTKFVAANGNAALTTNIQKFGLCAGIFDGTGDYLSVAASTDFNFGSGAFTVEGWTRQASGTSFGLVGSWSASTSTQAWFLGREGNNLVFRCYDSGGTLRELVIAQTWSAGTWYHIAADRAADGTLRIYRDGVVVASSAFAHTIRTISQPLTVGALGGSSTYDMNGYIDEVRLSKGVARYQGTFTPATSAFFEPDATPAATRRRVCIGMMG